MTPNLVSQLYHVICFGRAAGSIASLYLIVWLSNACLSRRGSPVPLGEASLAPGFYWAIAGFGGARCWTA